MKSYLLRAKDNLLNKIEKGNEFLMTFPLKRTGKMLNNYVRGEFIVISGRKTSGRSSFIMKNFIIPPILAKLTFKKDIDLKIIYFSTKSRYEEVLEKINLAYVVNKKLNSKVYNKLSLSSFYNYSGAEILLSKADAKKHLLRTVNVLSAMMTNNYLKIITGTQSIYEIKNIIKSSFSSYGIFDEDFESFTYKEEYEDMIPIIIIDDASMVLGEDGKNCIKNDNSSRLGVALKSIAKSMNAIVVLNVPSINGYVSQKEKFYTNKIEEVGFYSNTADKLIFMHNPQETNDKYTLNYEIDDFINNKTGVCYFRMMTIASNTLGPSGVTIPYFFFPQSGNMFELPFPEDFKNLKEYTDLVYATPGSEKNVKKDEDLEELN